MANQQLGTNFNSSNVAGSYTNGTAYNIIIQSNQLTSAQFNNIKQGRYTTSGWQYLTGAGLAGHIADETNLGIAAAREVRSHLTGFIGWLSNAFQHVGNFRRSVLFRIVNGGGSR